MNISSFRGSSIILSFGLALAPLAVAPAQDAEPGEAISRIVVTGDELPSAYGAPESFSRSRFSPTTTAYVLAPGEFFGSLIYQGDALRFNRPDHRFTQEFEVGLPHRFGLAIENSVEEYRGCFQERTFSVEARYALADWNKIPLNPTIFVEWKFGIGNILHDEGPPEPPAPGEAIDFLNKMMPLPDAYEVRLLLSQDFNHRAEWALNGFFEQEVGGDRGREYGFAQSLMFPVAAHERLKIGGEMLFTTFTDKGIRDMPSYRCVIGPSLSWKPSRNTRLDVSPLFGVTDDSPRASVFVVFSMLFGGHGAGEAEAPASTRNR
ncbi:MAG: hypothetical protein M3032_10125 [Verrucomicrobiota bacterium]|nr:hypothetical protein [Verrucomicrobiota bacterium]